MVIKGKEARKRYRMPIDYKTVHPSQTQPNMALGIEDILHRFVRGLPVDVKQTKGIYEPDAEMDLEKLSRMSNADKMYAAKEFEARASEAREKLEEMEQSASEEKERRAKERDKKRAAESGTGIEDLDNTMPDDTEQELNELQQKRSGSKKSKS